MTAPRLAAREHAVATAGPIGRSGGDRDSRVAIAETPAPRGPVRTIASARLRAGTPVAVTERMQAPRVLAATALLLAACGDRDGDGVPADAAPVIEGAWTITRTVRTQPAGCRELHPGELTATFDADGAPAIVIEGSSLKEWGQEVTADTASFITEDFAFPMESGRPVLISHELRWANSILIGTGGAQGDGDDIGCSWTVELVGIFVP